MANWSDASITITGDKESITKAREEILSLMETSEYFDPSRLQPSNSIEYRAGYGTMEIHDIEIGEEYDHIMINGSGRWCAPHGYIKDLCESINYHVSI